MVLFSVRACAVLSVFFWGSPLAFADGSTVIVPTTTVPATSTASAGSPAVSIVKNVRAFYEMWLRG